MEIVRPFLSNKNASLYIKKVKQVLIDPMEILLKLFITLELGNRESTTIALHWVPRNSRLLHIIDNEDDKIATTVTFVFTNDFKS